MAPIIYFDCPTGISGDMALASLIDLGISLDDLRAGLATLPLEGWTLEARRLTNYGITGTQIRIATSERQPHRSFTDIQALIVASNLPEPVKERSITIFARLAEAEAAIHGVDPTTIHFHEVGAVDSILDIVGFALGLHLLGIEHVYASPLPLGSGWIETAHGPLPVPAPATLQLLAGAGAPTAPDNGLRGELVTPTGAALLATCATFSRPALVLRRVGYGFGQRDLGRANALRAWLGETAPETDAQTPTTAVLLETNLDDQPGEQLAYTVERLLELGALDAWLTPVLMKKGRPAFILSALVPETLEDQAVTLIFRETTTLGVRRRRVERFVCERSISTVKTALGLVRVKEKRWRGELLGAAPEYEDCARLAREHNIPLREVYELALRAAWIQ
ncbi:MAG: UPF0272 protein [Herpetosiphonaceae bacterium]|nr:MAG: UPF0272 protein [Herpetosiphonaceae bacterium]